MKKTNTRKSRDIVPLMHTLVNSSLSLSFFATLLAQAIHPLNVLEKIRHKHIFERPTNEIELDWIKKRYYLKKFL